MLITSQDHTAKTLAVGADTFDAKAPGVFEVPEHIGRTLTAFPHFNVAQHTLSFYLPEEPEKKPVKHRTTQTRKKA